MSAEATTAELYQRCEQGVSEILARYHARRARLTAGARRRMVAPTSVVRGRSWQPKCLKCGRSALCRCTEACFDVAEGNTETRKRGHQHKDATAATDLPGWHLWTIDVERALETLDKTVHRLASTLLAETYVRGARLVDIETRYNLSREERERITHAAVVDFFVDVCARRLSDVTLQAEEAA